MEPLELAMEMLGSADDSGWFRRDGGAWARTLTFTAPLPRSLFGPICSTVYMIDAPEGVRVIPNHHEEHLSDDRRVLRLVVHTTQTPVTIVTATTTHGLFGRYHQGAA